MEKMIEFQVKYKGKTYNFDCGAAVYIFDIATCNGFAEAHDERTLLIISSWFVSVISKTTIRHRSVILRTL